MQEKKEKTSKARPFYLEMAEDFERKIRAGTYKPGEKLPSIEELTQKCNVHKNTVKSAFKTLRERGLVRNHSGVGIIVRENLKFPLKVALILPCGYEGLEELVSGIEESLNDYDAAMKIMFYRNSAEQGQCLDSLKGKDFSGVIIRPDLSGDEYSAVRRLQDERFPIVLIENFHPASDGWHVDAGAFEAAGLAVKHLRQLGRTPIGIISSPDKFGDSFAEGYKEAHFKLQMDCQRNNFRRLEKGCSAGETSVELFKLNNPPRSIIYTNPRDAAAGYKALRECSADLKWITIVSFGEVLNNELFEHPAIAIKRNFRELGFKAGKLLSEQIAAAPNQARRRTEKITVELK